MRKLRQQRGFTLIELLVVIAVIGILVTGLITIINPAAQFSKIRNATRKSDLRQLSDALKRYNLEHGTYPTTGGVWCGPSGYSPQGTGCVAATWIPLIIASGEIEKLPQDPKVGKTNPPNCSVATQNAYIYRSDGTNYKIMAHCTPEGIDVSTDSMVDPAHSYSWSVYSSGASSWAP